MADHKYKHIDPRFNRQNLVRKVTNEELIEAIENPIKPEKKLKPQHIHNFTTEVGNEINNTPSNINYTKDYFTAPSFSFNNAPDSILTKVDFPAPFSPEIACTSPGAPVKSTFRSA